MRYFGTESEIKFGDIVKSHKNGFYGIVVDIFDDCEEYNISVAVPSYYKTHGGRTAFIAFSVDEISFITWGDWDIDALNRSLRDYISNV